MKTRFFTAIRLFCGRTKQVAFLASCYAGQALADLPQVEQPTGGGGSGTWGAFMGYIKQGALALGLFVCVAALIAVAHAVITSFHDIRIGKGTWSQFLGFLVVGIIVILLVIYLANKASDVF
ncbi:TIGR03745 family integrating conjugative element membrane protein [Salmonella enterica subsp. enterica serovar Eastbourne]|nr:TIGR03745 family integrating conjugative element membrane protein [Salmonella enterica subsp. enterica serovar Eastbourne]EIE3222508.1 TIGR03745 family integrating conjugative element membrane protein [Salmonella enterica subsp. enterica serovar Typhimurium]EIF3372513.1 TIGR03745 family integrating conjugative element membrane protein [Salmonella enterica subsp. enterica serovar Typhimurium]EII7205920.1 TIGR03745 family integrating conjugative element membrane protein [Salmonella enterica sub